MSIAALLIVAFGGAFSVFWLLQYIPLVGKVGKKIFSPRLAACKILAPFDAAITIVMVAGAWIGITSVTGVGMLVYNVLAALGISAGVVATKKLFVPKWAAKFNEEIAKAASKANKERVKAARKAKKTRLREKAKMTRGKSPRVNLVPLLAVITESALWVAARRIPIVKQRSNGLWNAIRVKTQPISSLSNKIASRWRHPNR